MEKLHKQPDAYTRDYGAFMNELRQFHQNRGSYFRHMPRINGKDVDLYSLYNQVTAQGGWEKVNDSQKWDVILETLDIKGCVNASLALRQIYIRYLGAYEKIHFHGEIPENVQSTDSRVRKSYTSMLHFIPTTYNYAQHEISESLRKSAGLPPELPKKEYKKLCLSLLSGLPNEEDFTLNICSILANEGQHVLHLERTPQLVTLLLAQAGIWSSEDSHLHNMYLEHWKDLDGRRMERFWENILSNSDADVLQLWRKNKGKSPLTDDCFFNLGESLGTYNIEGQRVLRILLILHNLSFEEHNISVLAANSNCIRMLLLCVHCEWTRLRQIALDTLGNIASQVSLDIEKDPLSRLMWRTVTEGILAQDRHITIRSLEILAKLCQSENSEEVIASELQYEVCERMFMLLTIQDIMLLVHTLEALYAVSGLGKRTCEKIIRVHKCIAILVDLLTFDPENCKASTHKNFKLVETFETVNEPVSQKTVSRPGTPSHAASSVTSNQTESRTQPLSEVDSESFACNWLVNRYEISLGHSVARNDLYAEYVTACNKAGRKGVVNACVFANCVKNTFPYSGLRKVDSKNGIITFHHDGLKRKPNAGFSVPLVTNPGTHQAVTSGSGPSLSRTPSPCPSPVINTNSSPILKEKLTSTCSSTNSNQSRLQPSQISPGLTFVSGSSSLIKTLLASKVNKNLQRNQLFTQNPKLAPVSKTTLSELLSSATHSILSEEATLANPTLQVTLHQSIPSANSVTHATLSKVVTSVSSPKQLTSCYSVVPLNTSIPVQITSCQSVTLPNSNVQVTSTTMIMPDMTASQASSVSSVIPLTQVNTSNSVSPAESFRQMAFPESVILATSTSHENMSNSLISTSTASLSNYVNSPNASLIYVNNTNSLSHSNDMHTSQESKETSNQLKQQSNSQLSSHISNAVSTNHPTSKSETSIASSHVNGVQRDILSEICSKVFADDSLEEFSDLESSVENSHNHTVVVDGQDPSGATGQETAFNHLSNCVVSSGPGDHGTPQLNSLPFNVQITKSVDSLPSMTKTLAKSAIVVSNGNDQYGVTKLVLSSPVTAVATNSAYAVTTSRAVVSTPQVSETVVNVTKETEIPGEFHRRQLVKDNVFKSSPLLNGLLDKGKSPLLGEQLISLNAEAQNGSGENSCVSSPKIGNNSSVVLGRIVLDPKDIISGVPNLVGISNTGSGTIMATNQVIGSVERLQMGEISNTNSLFRESETSVSGTDLSSLSDIAQTVECASKVILRTNIENQCIQQPLSNTAVLQPANLAVSQVIPSSGCQTTTFIVSILNPSQALPTQHLLLRATGNSVARLEEPMELVRLPTVSKTQSCQQNVPSSQISVKRPSTDCTPSTVYPADSKRPRHDTKVSSKVAISYSPKVQSSQEVGPSSIKSSQTAKQNSHSSRTASSGSKSRSSSHYSRNNKELDPVSREKKGQDKQSSCITASKTSVNKATNKKLEYMCEWKGCGRTFPTPSAVLSHNAKCHVPAVQGNFLCQWENCDSLKRKQFSLLTHIQDHHCTDQYLQTQALRRGEISQRGKTTIPPPSLPPRHPGYSPDAAFLAIRRHALQFVQQKDKMEEEESPLTKSIRLTAALVLRNLIIYSELACSYLKYYEPELTLLAMSSKEGAQMLSHCLAELSKSQD
ncbi:AT-rich interactive domain-containing protein 2-like isoform X2 [Limulus polyphemus]|uniref:AT-rich interactive domain-containing protein 2-like isoform X2 n=1 Tax=Limulus polyphemus TaxID=6850 RepID=A0ABM1S5A9_LIMPO|nr:AT-rich interactive domain-containing protein 2-like isoform X2 [Limulus polyphemus]